jgi:hypothetical protein
VTRKSAIAAVIRQRTAVPNAWLASALELGHVSWITYQARAAREAIYDGNWRFTLGMSEILTKLTPLLYRRRNSPCKKCFARWFQWTIRRATGPLAMEQRWFKRMTFSFFAPMIGITPCFTRRSAARSVSQASA